jgi:hypothetical protein
LLNETSIQFFGLFDVFKPPRTLGPELLSLTIQDGMLHHTLNSQGQKEKEES